MRWLRWLSPYQYAWGAMLASEMEGEKYLFDTDLEGVAVEIEVTGRTYLDTFGVHPRTLGRDAGALGLEAVHLAYRTPTKSPSIASFSLPASSHYAAPASCGPVAPPTLPHGNS